MEIISDRGAVEVCAEYVIENLRVFDRKEFDILYPGEDIQKHIRYSLNASCEVWAFVAEGKCVAVGGSSYFNVGRGACIWLVGSHDADTLTNRRALLKLGRGLVKTAVAEYGRVWNFCTDDPGQLKAMISLGFEVRSSGQEGVRFICAS